MPPVPAAPPAPPADWLPPPPPPPPGVGTSHEPANPSGPATPVKPAGTVHVCCAPVQEKEAVSALAGVAPATISAIAAAAAETTAAPRRQWSVSDRTCIEGPPQNGQTANFRSGLTKQRNTELL